MKILLWSSYYPPALGGIEVFTQSLAQALKKQGHEILVFAANHNFKKYPVEINQYKGIEVYRLPSLEFFNQLRQIVEINHFLTKVVKDFSPDLIHLQSFELGFFYKKKILAALPTVPVLLTLHGVTYKSYYENYQSLFAFVDHLTGVSKAISHELTKNDIDFKKPYSLIYNGIDSDHAASPLPKGDILKLALIGRLSPEKGIDTAIQAVKILLEQGLNLHLTIVGDGYEMANLQSLQKKLGLETIISFTGACDRDQVYKHIADSHIILMPSHEESFGLSAAESGLLARPVIASNVGGLNEVIEHNKTGILVQAKNPLALAQAIDELWASPARLEKMSQAARQRILKFFSIEKSAANYQRLYKKLIQGNTTSEKFKNFCLV